jgi:hypothetical protein
MISASEFGDLYYEIVKIIDISIDDSTITLSNPLNLWHFGSGNVYDTVLG